MLKADLRVGKQSIFWGTKYDKYGIGETWHKWDMKQMRLGIDETQNKWDPWQMQQKIAGWRIDKTKSKVKIYYLHQWSDM